MKLKIPFKASAADQSDKKQIDSLFILNVKIPSISLIYSRLSQLK
jgi:hypothetical protein